MGTLKELARSYQGLVQDTTRVMNRLKAIFRRRAIGCAGREVYGTEHREPWLAQLTEPGLRTRAEALYQQLDFLRAQRQNKGGKQIQIKIVGQVQTPPPSN
jgi:hypothetical protein